MPGQEPTMHLTGVVHVSESGPFSTHQESAATHDFLPQFQRIAGYEIEGELGRGGMGVVFLARDAKLRRRVAVKMLIGGEWAGPDAMARFHAEGLAIAKLAHPHIVQVLEIGEHERMPYLALEYVDGGSLHQRCQKQRPEPRWVAEMVAALADAVQHAHSCGIIHRDLKPANVLLTSAGVPKIADFGLAKFDAGMSLADGANRTTSGMVVGTPSYMAPEQVQAKEKRLIGPAVDIYALGGILYETLVGRPAFDGEVMEVLMKVTSADPVPPRRLVPTIPLDLERICLKCLEKEPSRRYASAAELAADLRRFLRGEVVLARPVPWTERLWRLARRRPWEAGLATALSLALLTLVIASCFYNYQLSESLQATRAAEAVAKAHAEEARRQRDLAMQSYTQLITEAQELLSDPSEFRAARRRLLELAQSGLEELTKPSSVSHLPLVKALAHAYQAELIRINQGNVDDVRRQLLQAEQWLSAAPPESDLSRQALRIALSARSRVLNGLGHAALGLGRPDEAKSYFAKLAHATNAAMAADPGNRSAMLDRIRAYQGLALAAAWQRDRTGEEQALQQARAYADEMLRLDPQQPVVRRMCATVLDRLAAQAEEQGQYIAAIKFTQDAIKVLPNPPRNLEDRRNHMAMNANLGLFFQELGLLEEARNYVQLNVDQATFLANNDPDNFERQLDLLHAQWNLVGLILEEGNINEARIKLQSLVAKLEEWKKSGKLKGHAPFLRILDELHMQREFLEHFDRILADPTYYRQVPAEHGERLLVVRLGYLLRVNQVSDALATVPIILALSPKNAAAERRLCKLWSLTAMHLDNVKTPDPLFLIAAMRQACVQKSLAIVATTLVNSPPWESQLIWSPAFRPIRRSPIFWKHIWPWAESSYTVRRGGTK